MLRIRGICRHAVSVRLSVTFVNSVETNKRIFKLFPPSGSQTALTAGYQTSWLYSEGNPPKEGESVEYRWVRQKSRCWANIWLHHVLWTLGAPSAIKSAATDHGELMTLVAGKLRRLLMTETTTQCMTSPCSVTPKTAKQHLIVRSRTSEA